MEKLNIWEVARHVISICSINVDSIIDIRLNRKFRSLTILTDDNMLIVCYNINDPVHCIDIWDIHDKNYKLKAIKKYAQEYKFIYIKIAWLLSMSQSSISLMCQKYNI